VEYNWEVVVCKKLENPVQEGEKTERWCGCWFATSGARAGVGDPESEEDICGICVLEDMELWVSSMNLWKKMG